LAQWQATVTAVDGCEVTIDQTAFFPGGGGQPPDEGTVSWDGHTVQITPRPDLRLGFDSADPVPSAGTVLDCRIDTVRRALVMRTHTAMHVLSAIVEQEYSAPVTGCDMHPGSGRMDFDLATVPPTFREDLTRRLAAEVAADRPVSIEYIDPALFDPDTMVRASESLVPDGLDRIRLIRIAGLDLQADGGTHVASTGQIGAITITKVESKGRGHRRIRIALQE